MGLLGSLGQVAYEIIAQDKTGDGTKSSQKNLMAVGAVMTGVGAASVIMVNDVTNSFSKFDKSMTAVKALGAVSEEEFQKMEDACIDMSTQVPISATDVSDAMYKMVSVGYDFDTMMATIPEATKLAVGGNMALSDSVDAVINVFGAYGTATYSAADITNIMAKAVGVGKWELNDFNSEIMRNIGSASNLGVGFGELAAANVLLQNRFTSAEVAGTAMNAMLSRLVNPAVIKKLEDMGVHVKDNEGNFVGLESVLNQLDTALSKSGGNVDRMSVLQDIFGQEGVKAAIALIDEKDKLSGLSREMNDASFKQQAFNTVVGSYGAQQEIANNAMEAARIKLGEAMAPAVILTAGAVGGLADILLELPEPLQGVAGMALYAAQGFAALGPALMGLAALKGLGLGATLANIASGLSSVATGGIAAVAALGPLAPILIGLGLGLAAVYLLKEIGFLDWVSEQGANAGKALSRLMQDFSNWCMTTNGDIEQWKKGVERAFDISAASKTVSDKFDELKSGVSNWCLDTDSQIAAWRDGVVSSFTGAVGGIGTALAGIPGYLANSFTNITTAFTALGGNVQTAFTNLFTGIGSFIGTLAQGFISAGYNIIMYLVQGLQSGVGAITKAFSDIFSKLAEFVNFGSPAPIGPFSAYPKFGTYFSDAMTAAIPEITTATNQTMAAAANTIATADATTEIAANTTPIAAQPVMVGGGGTSIGAIDNSLSIGNVNASSDYNIQQIYADISALQAQKRKQKGYRSFA